MKGKWIFGIFDGRPGYDFYKETSLCDWILLEEDKTFWCCDNPMDSTSYKELPKKYKKIAQKLLIKGV